MQATNEQYDNLRFSPGVIRSPLARDITASERQELRRIFTYFAKLGSDLNVQSVELKSPISQRQVLYILSSDCAELIEAMFQLLALSGQNFHLEENNCYSFQLFMLFFHPELLPVMRVQQGWGHISDCSDILKEIRVYVRYYRRPTRTQRHKGYRDKGSLPDKQFQLRQGCLTEYYAEQARIIAEHDRELHDMIEVAFGFLS